MDEGAHAHHARLDGHIQTCIRQAVVADVRSRCAQRQDLGVRGRIDGGELATPLAAIAGGEHGRAEVRGATWTVRNVDAVAVAPGERARVVAVRGLELDIRSERSR